MVTEAARASVPGFGALRAFASAETAAGDPALSGLERATATAFWSDTLFVPGRVGDFGMIDFRFFIDGSFGIALGRGIIDRPHVFSTVDVGAAFCTTQSPCFKGLSGGSHDVRFFPDNRCCMDGVFGASGPATLPTLLVPLGVRNDLVIELDVMAEVGR